MDDIPDEFPPHIGSPESIPPTADLSDRVVALDRQRRWLELKCDDLRRSCRELVGSLNGRSPLSPAEVADLQADLPHRPMGEVFAAFRRLREEVTRTVPPAGESGVALDARAAELAEDVETLRHRRAELRRVFLALSDVVMPWEPPTEEEIHDMLYGPRGQSIPELLAEIEAELGEKL